jgi:hypothetical protein
MNCVPARLLGPVRPVALRHLAQARRIFDWPWDSVTTSRTIGTAPNLSSSWTGIHLEKLAVVQLFKKRLAIYVTRRYITVLITVRYWFLT